MLDSARGGSPAVSVPPSVSSRRSIRLALYYDTRGRHRLRRRRRRSGRGGPKRERWLFHRDRCAGRVPVSPSRSLHATRVRHEHVRVRIERFRSPGRAMTSTAYRSPSSEKVGPFEQCAARCFVGLRDLEKPIGDLVADGRRLRPLRSRCCDRAAGQQREGGTEPKSDRAFLTRMPPRARLRECAHRRHLSRGRRSCRRRATLRAPGGTQRDRGST